mgnify:CR=1 FL=1
MPDAPSGFRAFTAAAARQFIILNRHTYTLEMLIQAGGMGLAIDTAPVRVNPPTRPSRLASNMAVYLIRSAMTIMRMFIVYRPFRFFFFLGCAPLLAGLALLAAGPALATCIEIEIAGKKAIRTGWRHSAITACGWISALAR